MTEVVTHRADSKVFLNRDLIASHCDEKISQRSKSFLKKHCNYSAVMKVNKNQTTQRRGTEEQQKRKRFLCCSPVFLGIFTSRRWAKKWVWQFRPMWSDHLISNRANRLI